LAMGRRLRLEGVRVSEMVQQSYWDWSVIATLRWVGIILGVASRNGGKAGCDSVVEVKAWLHGLAIEFGD
jgi:hypothetical protein